MNGYEVDWSLFGSGRDELLLSDGPLDGEVDGLVTSLVPNLLELSVEFLVFNGELEVRLEVSVGEDDGDELVLVDVGDFEFLLGDGGGGAGGTGGGSVLILLVGKDVNADDGGLGRAVLSGLGSGVLGDLAGESLEHAVAALLDVSDQDGDAVSWSGISLLEGVFFVRHCWWSNIMLVRN